jgi:hypothetical protein
VTRAAAFAAACCLLVASLVAGASPSGAASATATATATAARTFYVDCAAGSDTAAGTSTSTAWRTLDRVNRQALLPGDRVRLKRTCVFDGQRLLVTASGTSTAPITITAYGSGTRPTIRNGLNQDVLVSGSWVVVEYLILTHTPRQTTACGQPIGIYYGVNLVAGSHDVVVHDNLVSGAQAGVHLAEGSWGNHVVANTITGNNVLDAFHANPAQDLGAWGVLVNGDRSEVAWNTFRDNRAVCSNQGYKLMSNTVEVYGGVGNVVHHNRSTGERVFSELGGTAANPAGDTVFAYNEFVSTLADSRFVVTRGAQDTLYGPVTSTTVVHNTTYQTGPRSQGVVCILGCSPSVLTMQGNVVWAEEKSVYADAAFSESGDVFWNTAGAPFVQMPAPLSPTSVAADPRFTSRATGVLSLAAGSPAVDRVPEAAPLPFAAGDADLLHVPVPQGGARDAGSYEQLP